MRKSISMARLWNNLPPEVIEIVLACLPVPVLCRFRLVCKRWNHLITQPRFASLCAQAPRQASYVLIAPRVVYLFLRQSKRNWEIMDMAEKRFYTLSDSFIVHYLYRKFKPSVACVECTLASDGGLIYAMYFNLGQPQRHIVFNPVSKDIHQITEPRFDFSYERDIVVMSVDNATQSYKIIIMEAYDSTRSRREEVYLYDSTTLQWWKLCKVPGDEYCVCSSIFLKGVFYTLFADLSMAPWCRKLYSCHLETGAWSYIDIDLPQPSHPQDKSLLVVSLGRLFFVEYTGLPRRSSHHMTIWENLIDLEQVKKKHLIKVRISEILLNKKEVVKVAEMPKYSKYPRRMFNERHFSTLTGKPVVALGCGDLIVISSLVDSRCVGFDLLKNSWQELPSNIKHMYGTFMEGLERENMYAGHVHLDLRKMSS